ncbi:MAG: IS200/IS605 family transposase [Thermodesulfobacteriota bacterium]|nr:IS200/IS605 family transposase [Thermodesulfobacteriota bacterium]
MAWTPKYRYRIPEGKIADLVNYYCIRAYSEQSKCEVVELNVQIDHVHLISMVPPKISISDYPDITKGLTSIRVLNTFRHLREKPYRGNHFWSRDIEWIPYIWIHK